MTACVAQGNWTADPLGRNGLRREPDSVAACPTKIGAPAHPRNSKLGTAARLVSTGFGLPKAASPVRFALRNIRRFRSLNRAFPLQRFQGLLRQALGRLVAGGLIRLFGGRSKAGGRACARIEASGPAALRLDCEIFRRLDPSASPSSRLGPAAEKTNQALGNEPPKRLAEESLETLKRKRPIETPEAPNVPQSESNRRRGLGQSKTC